METTIILDKIGKKLSPEVFLERIGTQDLCAFGCTDRNAVLHDFIGERRISAVFDNSTAKQGTTWDGIPVEKPHFRGNTVVLTTIWDCFPVGAELQELGYQEFYFFLPAEIYAKRYEKALRFYEAEQALFRLKNTSYRYVHIMPDQKFIRPVAAMLERNFDIKEHLFVMDGFTMTNVDDEYHLWDWYVKEAKQYGNILILGGPFLTDAKASIQKEQLLSAIAGCQRLFFHGIWLSRTLTALLSKHTEDVKRCGFQIPWSYEVDSDTKQQAIERVIKYCKWMVVDMSLLEEDRRRYLKHFLLDEQDLIGVKSAIYSWPVEKPKPEQHALPHVLISHSCYYRNRTLETMDVLKPFAGKIEVYAILSYGDPDYKEKTKEKGLALFGDKFHAVTDFLDYEEYVRLIGRMDASVFAMEEAAAYDTMQILAYTGTKMYFVPGSPAEGLAKGHGYQTFSIEELKDAAPETLFENPYAAQNEALSLREFDEANMVREWQKVLGL